MTVPGVTWSASTSRRGMTMSAPLRRSAIAKAASAIMALPLSDPTVAVRRDNHRRGLTRPKPRRISCWNTTTMTIVATALTADSKYEVRMSPR